MDLDAVHHGEVLIGSAAAHGEAAAELLDAGHAGQRLQGAEDVVRGAGHGEHVGWPHGQRRGAAVDFADLRLDGDLFPKTAAGLEVEVDPPIDARLDDDRLFLGQVIRRASP